MHAQSKLTSTLVKVFKCKRISFGILECNSNRQSVPPNKVLTYNTDERRKLETVHTVFYIVPYIELNDSQRAVLQE